MYKSQHYGLGAIGVAVALNFTPVYATDEAKKSLLTGESTLRMWVTERYQGNTLSQGKEREVRFIPERLASGGLKRLEDALGPELFKRVLDNKVPRLPGSEADQWEPSKPGVVYEEGTSPNHFYKPGQVMYDRFIRLTGDKANALFDATCHDANFTERIKGVGNDETMGNMCAYMDKRVILNGAEVRKDGSWKPDIVRFRIMHLNQKFTPQRNPQ
jgi:hypothetical protein